MNAIFSCETLVCPTLLDTRKVELHEQALCQLGADLEEVQSRLGTDQERPGDCELARELGHNVRNKLLILNLWDSVALLKSPRKSQIS